MDVSPMLKHAETSGFTCETVLTFHGIIITSPETGMFQAGGRWQS
jgi:hypothetical protein